jgi:hypothetical protein
MKTKSTFQQLVDKALAVVAKSRARMNTYDDETREALEETARSVAKQPSRCRSK